MLIDTKMILGYRITNKGISYYKTLGFYVQKRKVGDFCYEQPVILIDKERWFIIQYNCVDPCLKAGDFFSNLKMGKPKLYYGASAKKKYEKIIKLLNSWGYEIHWTKSHAADGYWDLCWKGNLSEK